MKVRFAPRAFSDLDAIRSYIAQRNPVAAGRASRLSKRLLSDLAIFPSPDNDPMRSMHASSFRLDTRIVSIIGLPPARS